MKSMRRQIDVETLRLLLNYDPITGSLTWKKRGPEYFKSGRNCNAWNAKHAGKIAINCPDDNGYLTGTLLGVPARSHCIAWCLITGEWPALQIDHKNRNRSDNRFENLRLATHNQNMMNRSVNCNNSTPFKGAHFTKRNGMYSSAIRADGKQYWLGYHQTPEEAHAAYVEAAKQLHGEFARAA